MLCTNDVMLRINDVALCANETSKWLEMLFKSNYIDDKKYNALNRKCSTIKFLLVKSITTAKSNNNN